MEIGWSRQTWSSPRQRFNFLSAAQQLFSNKASQPNYHIPAAPFVISRSGIARYTVAGSLSFAMQCTHAITMERHGTTERGVVNENDTRDFFTRVKHEFWIVFKVFVESKEGGRQERFLPTGSKIRVAMYLLDIGVEIESIFPWKSSSFDLLWTRITIHIGVNRIELGEEWRRTNRLLRPLNKFHSFPEIEFRFQSKWH